MEVHIQIRSFLLLAGDGTMKQTVVRRCLSAASILSWLMVGACSNASDRAIRIDRHADSYTLKFRVRPLEGLCYAPESIAPNGYLSLEGFDGPDRWVLAQAAPTQIEGLREILSRKRVKIVPRGMEVSVPIDAVVKRPFHLQFVAFPCQSPAVWKSGSRNIYIVSVTADLLPSHRTVQKRGALDQVGDEELMTPR